MAPSSFPKQILRSQRQTLKVVSSHRIAPSSFMTIHSNYHPTTFNLEKVPEDPFEKLEIKKEDKTERVQEYNQTVEDAYDMRDIQEHHNTFAKNDELKSVSNSDKDINEVKIDDFIDDVLADINLDFKTESPDIAYKGEDASNLRKSPMNSGDHATSQSTRGSSPKRFDQDTYMTSTQFTHTDGSDRQSVLDKIKNHPRYDWALFRKHENETESDVDARLLQKFEVAKRKHDEKRMKSFLSDKEEGTKRKKKKKPIIEAGWEDIAISNIVEYEAKLHAKNDGKIVRIQDLLYKDPVTNEDKASVTLIKNLDPSMVPRVNSVLTQEYSAISYLHKDTLETLKSRLEMHMKSNDPLPEDLIPFKKIMEARGEKLKQLQDEQFLGKLVPINTRPLHLWDDISSTPIGKHRSQWKKKRMLLNRELRDRERNLKRLSKVPMPDTRVESLDLRWRSVYQFYMNRLRNEIRPDGDWREARENYRKIRSIFSSRINLNENLEHLELYLLGHAKFWDWDKARNIFMKKYKTLWNIHPKLRDNSLTPIFIMMRGLAYRKRSFKEVLAMHSLVADEAANGLLFEHAVPPKWYYDSVLNWLIEEKNWDLAKQWFIQFYQSTLYSRAPSPSAHVLPDNDTIAILLKGARLIPKVASIESHMILDAARRDLINWQTTFSPTTGMIKELMEAHLQDGDGAGAAIVFKRSFETPFSTGILQFSNLDLDQQKEFLHLYYRGLGQSKNLNEIYKSLTALYRFDPSWMQDTAFHNQIMENLSNLNYSLGVHFLKSIFKINGRMHYNPVHPDFYTFETIMLRAVKNRRFLFARGLVNLAPPTIHGMVRQKLKNMSGLALRTASQSEYKGDLEMV